MRQSINDDFEKQKLIQYKKRKNMAMMCEHCVWLYNCQDAEDAIMDGVEILDCGDYREDSPTECLGAD